MPVIASSILSRRRIVCIEQPEIHLHPKHQTELANLFVECCKKENNIFIIETHSEHLLLRLRNLIRKGEISNEDVSIVYVNKDEGKTYCKEIRVNKYGNLIERFPEDFFDVSYREVMDICF